MAYALFNIYSFFQWLDLRYSSLAAITARFDHLPPTISTHSRSIPSSVQKIKVGQKIQR